MATVLERVQKIVAERLGVEEAQVVEEASFTEDLEADSLDLVDLILAFQDEFSTGDNPVEISDEDAEKMVKKIEGRIEVVGNTVLDNLVDVETYYEDRVLITLHRRENHSIMDLWFKKLDSIASKYKDIEFTLPIHPNPNVLKQFKNLKQLKT